MAGALAGDADFASLAGVLARLAPRAAAQCSAVLDEYTYRRDSESKPAAKSKALVIAGCLQESSRCCPKRSLHVGCEKLTREPGGGKLHQTKRLWPYDFAGGRVKTLSSEQSS